MATVKKIWKPRRFFWVCVCMCVFVQYQAVRSLACDIVDLCSEQIVTNRFWN